SEDTAVKIDQEVKRIVTGGLEKAREILEKNREALVRLAEALLEYEVLDSTEIEQVMRGLPIDPERHSKKANSDGKKGSPVEDTTSQSGIPLVNPKNKPAPA